MRDEVMLTTAVSAGFRMAEKPIPLPLAMAFSAPSLWLTYTGTVPDAPKTGWPAHAQSPIPRAIAATRMPIPITTSSGRRIELCTLFSCCDPVYLQIRFLQKLLAEERRCLERLLSQQHSPFAES